MKFSCHEFCRVVSVQAAQPPRHKLKPHLTPVSVVPLVPDLTLWDRDLCTVILDTDPTPEGEPYVRLGPADRHHLTARSYMRLATISGQGGRFLGFLTPSGAFQDLRLTFSVNLHFWVNLHVG